MAVLCSSSSATRYLLLCTAIVVVLFQASLRGITPASIGGSPAHVEKKQQLRGDAATSNLAFSGEKMRSFPGERRLRGWRRRKKYPRINVVANLNGTSRCERWGVVHTVVDPTEAVVRVAKLPSWCLVVVPDLATPRGYMAKLRSLLRGEDDAARHTLENVFYLSVEEQRQWEGAEGPFGAFVTSTPWRHFCRKNVGYLFAIVHGAQFVFDFEDDSFLHLDSEGLPVEILPPGKRSTMALSNVSVPMVGPHVFNHHPTMGASVSDSWARGFPLSLVQDNATRGSVAFETELPFVAREKEIGVVQFLADGDPDIDATHRMTRPLPLTFEGNSSVLVPVHAYSPYNAQATVHTRNAFWAMLLPSTVPRWVSDIWRSYFAQCIFADAGLRLVFSPPKVTRERNDHDHQGDFDAEHDLHKKAGKLVEHLSEWDSTSDNVPERMEDLFIGLYERGYIEFDDVLAVQLWLESLIQAGYEFPSLKRRHRNVAVMSQANYADRESSVQEVIFVTQKYREYFHTVLSTGPFSESQMEELRLNSIAVHHGADDAGYHSPLRNLKDTLHRFKNSTTIEGVLYLYDDGVLNVTELTMGKYPFPVDKLMKTHGGELMTLENKKSHIYRAFPDGHTETANKSASFHSFDEMVKVYPFPEIWPHFNTPYCAEGQMKLTKDPASQIYQESDGSILFPDFQQSDFVFVPMKYVDEFTSAAELHLKHGIWIECAFPKIFHIMHQRTDAQVRSVELCTNWNWGGIRGNPSGMAKFCSESDGAFGFAHPLKISSGGYSGYSEAFDRLQAAPLRCHPIKAAAQCTVAAKGLGPFSTPEDCARQMTDVSDCGGTFMFSHAYPVWGCSCCAPDDIINESGNDNWALYSAHDSASYPGTLTCCK